MSVGTMELVNLEQLTGLDLRPQCESFIHDGGEAPLAEWIGVTRCPCAMTRYLCEPCKNWTQHSYELDRGNWFCRNGHQLDDYQPVECRPINGAA